MRTEKALFRAAFYITLLSAFLLVPRGGHAYNSKAWKERLAARTATLWVDGQFLGDDIVLNARGELSVTWLERRLSQALSVDDNVDEWVTGSLSYYFSNRKEIKAKLKGRDVFVLNYRAIKNWSFDPAKLAINGYTITPDDILTRAIYLETELASGSFGTVAVAAPSLKPGQTVELRYEDAVIEFEVPRFRVR